MKANKVQMNVIPDKKPAGGLPYSTSKPIKTNHLSPHARTAYFQCIDEMEIALNVAKMEVDHAERVREVQKRLMVSLDAFCKLGPV